MPLHPPDDTDRLDAQLDRLRAVLRPADVGREAGRRSAVELLAPGSGEEAGLWLAVRVTEVALSRPGATGDWRLTTIALTGLDPRGPRFVPLPPDAVGDVLSRLGLPRGAARCDDADGVSGCTSVRVVIRDHSRIA